VATGAAWLKGRNSRGGREEQKHPYKKKKRKSRKTHLTHTGLLMEGPTEFATTCEVAYRLPKNELEKRKR
jgi:hypothetical protein